MTKDKIVLTGGGTTGHVAVNLALIPILKKDNWEIHYIGSKNGIEKDLIENIDGVKYHSISTGKLRRQFSFRNITDIFRVLWGSIQSVFKIAKIRPNVAFSKGGFVSVPVLFGAWVNRVPAISHESDLTPGLANKLVQPFVKTIFTTFPETEKYIKSGKGKFLGPVIRQDLKDGNKEKGKRLLGITNDKPIILVMGGSLGAKKLNDLVRDNLDNLLKDYNIIHAAGKDGYDSSIKREGYYQFEYLKEELKDILAASDIVISRAGANSIFEFLYYKIPMLLIPLPAGASRGDQVDNAKSFANNGFALLLEEKSMNDEIFLEKINELHSRKQEFKGNMNKFEFADTVSEIYNSINNIKK